MTKTTPSPAHSPAPWFYDQVTLDVDDSNGDGVAELYLIEHCDEDDEPKTRANGHLIAAAPELLQQLKNLLEDLQGAKELMLEGDESDSWMRTADGWDALIHSTETVIAKAEGNQIRRRKQLLAPVHTEPATATTPAYTRKPWRVCRSSNQRVYDGENHFAVQQHPESGSGCIIADIESSPGHAVAEANARLIATAPELLVLAKTFRATCTERISLLRDERKEAFCDSEDIHDQLAHWQALHAKCATVIANALGQEPRKAVWHDAA